MGDECTCEKCQTGRVKEAGVLVWQVNRAETRAVAEAPELETLTAVVQVVCNCHKRLMNAETKLRN